MNRLTVDGRDYFLPEPVTELKAQILAAIQAGGGYVNIPPLRGGPGAVHGVWVYDRQGTEVIGYFAGSLRGNVLDFTWQEPGADGTPLSGAGYLVFDPQGRSFTGRWWTDTRDRGGDWNGWRAEAAPTQTATPSSPSGGSSSSWA